MPRGARISIPNAYYHIINRGNQKQKLFLEEADFEKYLELLKHFKRKYSYRVFGYCLMPNHIHIILKPSERYSLSRFMQSLTQTYTAWFNKKYSTVGHLWQGRFKSMIIQNNPYFLDCVYYVEANPVRAGFVEFPKDYLWSSYAARVFGRQNALLDIPDST